jgi:hypothetical protein
VCPEITRAVLDSEIIGVPVGEEMLDTIADEDPELVCVEAGGAGLTGSI